MQGEAAETGIQDGTSAQVSPYVDTAPNSATRSKKPAKPPRRLGLMARVRGMAPETRIAQAAAMMHVKPEDVTGVQRTRTIASARHIAAWLLRQDGGSFPEIGRALGFRDHTTVMNSVERIEMERAQDPDLARLLDGMVGG